MSTPPGLSQTSTPFLLMPRHPPCALTSLTTSIQGSNKLPFRSLRVGYPWCLAQRFPSRYSAGITELYPSNARNLSPTRPQGTGWKLKMPSTTTKLSKNFSPESAKSRILYSGDFDVNRGYARDPRKRRQPTREVTYCTRNWFAGKWRLGVFPRHRISGGNEGISRSGWANMLVPSLCGTGQLVLFPGVKTDQFFVVPGQDASVGKRRMSPTHPFPPPQLDQRRANQFGSAHFLQPLRRKFRY